MTSHVLQTYGASLVGALLIATVHLLAGRMHFLDRRNGAALDFLAGIAVAYAFVDILPHLASKQAKFAGLSDEGVYGLLQHHTYILALAGFLTYLAVILLDEKRRESISGDDIKFVDAPLPVKIEAVSLAGYAFIIGYMLAEQPTHRIEPALVFAAAMVAHFIGLDYLFHHRYPRLYDSFARYLLAVGVLLGWLLGWFAEMPDVLYAATFAFLAGGIIIATVIFELPRVTSQRRYWSFSAGAACFTLVVLVLEFVRNLE
jgi:hypothetical protein